MRRKGLLKVKQVPKKYDDLSGKLTYPYLLEQIKLPKKSIPKELWKEYERFSIKKKEDIRKQLVLEEEEQDAFGRRGIPHV